MLPHVYCTSVRPSVVRPMVICRKLSKIDPQLLWNSCHRSFSCRIHMLRKTPPWDWATTPCQLVVGWYSGANIKQTGSRVRPAISRAGALYARVGLLLSILSAVSPNNQLITRGGNTPCSETKKNSHFCFLSVVSFFIALAIFLCFMLLGVLSVYACASLDRQAKALCPQRDRSFKLPRVISW